MDRRIQIICVRKYCAENDIRNWTEELKRLEQNE
jgi:hypothetical protein